MLINVNLSNINITEVSQSAGLVAVNNGLVSNSSVSGLITGKSQEAGSTIAGLVGINNGIIDNSNYSVNVSGDSNNSQIGGLVAINNGTIAKSYVENSTVTGNSYITHHTIFKLFLY